jgi:hypothetical protein
VKPHSRLGRHSKTEPYRLLASFRLRKHWKTLSESGRDFWRIRRAEVEQQDLIHEVVTRRPDISAKELLETLRGHRPPVEDIDGGTIHFANRDGSYKEAPISGLKDRLTRARKKLKSR